MPSRQLTEQDFSNRLGDIFKVAEQLHQFEANLNRLFPERAFLIRQMILAVLMRQNVLIYGQYGTAKSWLIRQFIEGIGADPAELFSIELTRYTTESDVFGPVDVAALRDHGIQRRNPEGSIRTATFADVGEIFDGESLLRSLLGVLNERFYSRGADSGPVPLHSAFASTNIDPIELVKRYPRSDAVVDRFLFQCQVDWLEGEDSMITMFKNYLGGATIDPNIDHDKLLAAASLVVSATDQIDLDFLSYYVKIVTAIRHKWNNNGWRRFSDRAVCQWLGVLEANAVLSGRYKVTPADFSSLKYVACNGGDGRQLSSFDEVAGPLIEEAIDSYTSMSIDQAVLLAIESIRTNWPLPPTNTANAAELVDMRRLFEGYKKNAFSMKPELDATNVKVRNLTADIDERIALIDQLIAGA